MKVSFLCLLLIVTCFTFEIRAQGCSDAGFCTMGAMKPSQGFSRKINFTLRSIEFSQYYGLTSFYLTILSYTVDANIGITNKLTAQVKLPYQFVYGFLTNTNGLGDVSVSLTQNLVAKEKYQLNVTLGAKIPTGNANKQWEGKALPMYYQTSLGTWDVVGGISLSTKNWLFATGYQQALTTTPNQFLWGPWNKSDDSTIAAHYPKSNQLIRGKDVMLRAERNLRFSNWNVNIGLLGIYRLTKDSFVDGDKVRKDISGSDGLALTLLGGFGYRFNTKSAIKIMGGYRLVNRTITQNQRVIERNPDGLSRLLVTTIGYEYRF